MSILVLIFGFCNIEKNGRELVCKKCTKLFWQAFKLADALKILNKRVGFWDVHGILLFD